VVKPKLTASSGSGMYRLGHARQVPEVENAIAGRAVADRLVGSLCRDIPTLIEEAG
jgi:hypothetical protein